MEILRKKGGVSHFCKGLVNENEENLGNIIKAGIPGGQLLRAQKSQRPLRATSSVTCYLRKEPPTPSGTEHWILGHQGLPDQVWIMMQAHGGARRRGDGVKGRL